MCLLWPLSTLLLVVWRLHTPGHYSFHKWQIAWWEHPPISSPWRWRQQAHLKLWWTSTRLHGATTQKTVIFILATMRTWSLTKKILGYLTTQLGCLVSVWSRCLVLCCSYQPNCPCFLKKFQKRKHERRAVNLCVWPWTPCYNLISSRRNATFLDKIIDSVTLFLWRFNCRNYVSWN
jgi:hypothetical protein